MGNKSRLGLALLLGLLWLGSGTTDATTFLQFQSTYLGDGWFQYQMNVLNEVSLLPVSGTGWEVKIGAGQAGFTEKLRFGIANWLSNWIDNLCGGGKNYEKGPCRSWA